MQMPTNVVTTTPDFLVGYDGGHPVLFPGSQALAGPTGAEVTGGVVLGMAGGNTSRAASLNVGLLQSALNRGGLVQILTPGTYYISDTLWLDDNTQLMCAPGVLLKLFAGSNKLMVGTAPLRESATTVTVAWTNGITASITWTAHGKTAGNVICLQGAVEVQWNTVYRVISVTDANTLVIALPEFASAAPTGTITARRCVRNVGVVGAFDYDYSNNPSAAAGYDRHVCCIAFAADIPAENLRVEARNCYKFALNTCATMNVRGSVTGYSAGDIYKMYGPARDTYFSVAGTSKDDCASIQAKEPPAFLAYMPAYGPVKDCGLVGLSVVNTGGTASGAVVVYADTDHEIDNILIEGGSAISNLNSALAIKYGTGFSSGKIRRVRIRDLALAPLIDSYTLVVSATVDHLEIDRPRIIPGTSAAANAIQLMRFESTTTIGVLRILNWEFNQSDWPSTGAASYMVNLNGVINMAEFVGCYIRGRSSQARFITVGTNGVQTIALRDCDFENLSQIGVVNDGASGVIRIIMDGNRMKTVTAGWDIRDDATVLMSGNNFDSMTNGVVRPTTNARTVNVYDLGGNTYTSASAITCAAPGTAIPHGIELPIDVGATGITKAAGASAFNTGSARGTLVQNRPVICDGTSWFQMTDLTKTF